MDKARVEKLLETAAPDEKAKLGMLYNATLNSLKGYQSSNSATDLRNWQAAEKALDGLVESLESVYLPDAGGEQVGAMAPSAVIGNKMDVVRWLSAEGFCARGKTDPVKKSTVYKDAAAGLLVAVDPRAITYGEVLAYIRAAGLTRVTPVEEKANEIEELSYRRAKAAAENEELKNAKLKREEDREMGRLIERAEVRRQLAGKFGLLESVLKNHGRTFMGDLISCIGGNAAKLADGVDMWNAAVDGALTEVGRFDEINIVVRKRD